jgi:hypothetical protein
VISANAPLSPDPHGSGRALLFGDVTVPPKDSDGPLPRPEILKA